MGLGVGIGQVVEWGDIGVSRGLLHRRVGMKWVGEVGRELGDANCRLAGKGERNLPVSVAPPGRTKFEYIDQRDPWS